MKAAPGRTLIALREGMGEKGRYALVVGDDLRTLPAESGEAARAADHPDDLQAALTQFIEGGRGAGSGSGGRRDRRDPRRPRPARRRRRRSLLLVSRRRERKARNDGRSEVGEINQTDDFVRLGDQIRALELDITLGDAGRPDYDRALEAYDRANDLQRSGDEAGANRALDEGLAAIASAREQSPEDKGSDPLGLL